MDKLKIGALRRNGDAMFTTAQVEGMTVPALELRMEGPVDRELLDALAEGRLEVCGAGMGRHCDRSSGYCRKGLYTREQLAALEAKGVITLAERLKIENET